MAFLRICPTPRPTKQNRSQMNPPPLIRYENHPVRTSSRKMYASTQQLAHLQISSSQSRGSSPDPAHSSPPESRDPVTEAIMDQSSSSNEDTSRQSDPSAVSTDQGFVTGDSLISTDFDSENALPGFSIDTTKSSILDISNKKENINNAYAHSPTVFRTPKNKISTVSRIDWSIEHKSSLFPAKIDESFYYNSPLDNDKSMRLRQESDKFWAANKQIAPSPMVMLPNHVKGPSFTPSPATPNIIMARRTSMKALVSQETHVTPVLCRQKSIFMALREQDCQTDLSIPTDVDIDFAAIVQQQLQRRRVASTPQKKTPEERYNVASPEASIIQHSPRNILDDYSFEENSCFAAEIEDNTMSTSPLSLQHGMVSFRGDVGTEVSELVSFDSFGLPPMSPINPTLAESIIPESPPPSSAPSPSRLVGFFQSPAPPQATSSFSNSGMPKGHDHLETIAED